MDTNVIETLNQPPYDKMDAYNLGINYLRIKYGMVGHITKQEMLSQITDMEDKEIVLLLGQYYYGIPAKKDLHFKMEQILNRRIT